MIFEYQTLDESDRETEQPKATRKKSNEWIEIGIAFRKAKEKGISATKFALQHGINYATFTKSMHRYKSQIDAEIQRRKKETEERKTRNDYRKKHAIDIINDFRNSLKKVTVGVPMNKRQKDSTDWFTGAVKSAIKTHKVSRPATGRIYTFVYDAKYKAKLPYWDRFPLIVFLGSGVSKAGNVVLYGLNMHYIPPKARQSFLEELLKRGFATTKRLSNKTVFKINWGSVKGIRGSDIMIKSYLPSHVKSGMMEIAPKDWAKSVWLPTQSFVSKGKPFGSKQVWSRF